MYEFTNKEIRDKFAKTETGQKVNKYLKISVIVFIALALLIPLVFIIVYSFKDYSILDSLDQFGEYLDRYLYFILIPLLISVYFDGKRDGLIEMYQKEEKSKKEDKFVLPKEKEVKPKRKKKVS